MAAAVVAALLLVGAVVALIVSRGGGTTPVAETPQTQPTPVVLPGPAIETAAADLLVLFKDKRAEAEGRYKGNVVDVTGSVFASRQNLAGERAVLLEGDSQAKFAGVRCVFPPANYFQLEGIAVGENVTIRGRCEGLVSDVVLRDCAVLKAGD